MFPFFAAEEHLCPLDYDRVRLQVGWVTGAGSDMCFAVFFQEQPKLVQFAGIQLAVDFSPQDIGVDN